SLTINGDCSLSYVSFSANIGTSSSVTFGCNFGNNCYGSYGDAWLKEFAFYQSYTGSYPRIPPVYIDLPVVHRAVTGHETCLTMEGHQPWNWSNKCSGQLYCPKDQTQSPHIWKPSLTGKTCEICSRGRKKRVAYTKLQLKELEREYANTKFTTNEKRRRIAFSTNLSERQVTIWFQPVSRIRRDLKSAKIFNPIKDSFMQMLLYSEEFSSLFFFFFF
uniref:Homeobox D13a n=1 Tax=Sinocyclocheilus anshuiensis TaxID=1608454 RepID=A0A671PUQ8_9TELE